MSYDYLERILNSLESFCIVYSNLCNNTAQGVAYRHILSMNCISKVGLFYDIVNVITESVYIYLCKR